MKKLFVLVFVIALSLCALTIGASAASSAPAGEERRMTLTG